MLLDLQGHVDDLIVSVRQKIIEVVQGRWVLVLEPVEQPLLNHSKLDCAFFQEFSERSEFCPQLEMMVKYFKEVVVWKLRTKFNDIFYITRSMLSFKTQNQFPHNRVHFMQRVRYDPYFGFVLGNEY